MFLRAAADGDLLDDRGHAPGHGRHAARHPLPLLRHHDIIRGEVLTEEPKSAKAPLIRNLLAGGQGVLQGLPLPAGGGHLPRHLHRQVGASPQSGLEAGGLGGSQSCVVSSHTAQPKKDFLRLSPALPMAPCRRRPADGALPMAPC